MGIFKSRLFIALISFWLGVATPFLIFLIGLGFIVSDPARVMTLIATSVGQAMMAESTEADFSVQMQKMFDQGFSDESFAKLQKMQDDIMKSNIDKMKSILDPNFFGADEMIKFEQSEDQQHVFVSIYSRPAKDDRLDIKVEDGSIRVTGDFQMQTQTANGYSYSRKKMTRQFPIPEGVENVPLDVRKEEERFVIVFRKI